jgi:hypothetical protein
VPLDGPYLGAVAVGHPLDGPPSPAKATDLDERFEQR